MKRAMQKRTTTSNTFSVTILEELIFSIISLKSVWKSIQKQETSISSKFGYFADKLDTESATRFSSISAMSKTILLCKFRCYKCSAISGTWSGIWLEAWLVICLVIWCKNFIPKGRPQNDRTRIISRKNLLVIIQKLWSHKNMIAQTLCCTKDVTAQTWSRKNLIPRECHTESGVYRLGPIALYRLGYTKGGYQGCTKRGF